MLPCERYDVGLLPDFIRDQPNLRAALFYPDLAKPCVQGKHLMYRWDGEKIAQVLEVGAVKRAFVGWADPGPRPGEAQQPERDIGGDWMDLPLGFAALSANLREHSDAACYAVLGRLG
jgi:hypothetical protein